KAVAPILDDGEVRDALADLIVGTLYDRVDVAGELRGALPAGAATLAPTIAASIRTTSVQLAATALGTKEARRVWKDANRLAHQQVVQVLEGKGKVVTARNGEVAIDTRGLADAVRRALDDAGIYVFDSVRTGAIDERFVLFHSTELAHAQTATRILDDAGTWLPVVTIVVFAAAVFCARDRRRTVEHIAIGVALAMLAI